MQRNLGRDYNLITATSPEEGLFQVRNQSFAVVVSDLHMPGMSGIDFLMQSKSISPDSIRIILTGRADLSLVMNAINETHIFRFLTKPVPPAIMRQVFESSVKQYDMDISERELLSKTLVGSVQVLLEILRRLYPDSVESTGRLKEYTHKIVSHLALAEGWRFELAAMLSPIGLITAPQSILYKLQKKQPLASNEQKIFIEHIGQGRDLLAKIPRLEVVAEIIGKQHQELPRSISKVSLTDRDPVLIGAQILQICTRYDYLMQHYRSGPNTLAHMYLENKYDTLILDALRATL